MKNSVAGVVLAAGRGQRFGGHKQFLSIDGTRLVDRALQLVASICRPVVLVLPPNIVWTGPAVDAVVVGGQTRVDSLRKAVSALPGDIEIVVVHDAVRPMATAAVIEAAIAAIQDGADAAVPVWMPTDVIKRIHGDGTLEHVGREGFAIAQSPCACRYSTLLRALASPMKSEPAEESEAIERVGGRVVGVPGDPWSQHVVVARDLELVGRIIRQRGGYD